ncbi:cupin domain-containing protein [Kibdelosporangium philippinense]|uniref:asparaginase n=1 Tax=Kibdelosporangium philippinense TaxID=211113 RepID=A0ABS8Z7M4_9PSEU|nr:cupin domain-containing protein [Kibdelosporangium philippinense]MCE7003889.1 cupin domain-containing protein [Kibdelosporangium philippinense]
MIDRRSLLRTGGTVALGAFGIATCACSSPAGARNPAPTTTSAAAATGVIRVELQRTEAPFAGFEIIQTRFEIPVGQQSGRHSHDGGKEVGYIIQGDVLMEFEDRPVLRLKSGDPFLIPTGVVHNARNVGTVQTMMLSTYCIDASKPLVTPH